MDINAHRIMNITKYILVAIVVFSIAACNKETVHLDASCIPVKVPSQDGGFNFAFSDGVMCLNQSQSPLSYYVIKQDGSVVQSDSLYYTDEGYAIANSCTYNNNHDELFITFPIDDKGQFALAKFYSNCRLAYYHTISGIASDCAAMALDNGEFAIFVRDFSEADDDNRIAMRIINTDGCLEDYMVYLEDDLDDGFFDELYMEFYNFNSFGDRIMVSKYDYVEGATSFRIYKTDGTYVTSGLLESAEGEQSYDPLEFKYAGGNVYLINTSSNLEDCPHSLSKIDPDGNVIFTATLSVNELSPNVLAQDGTLIVLGTSLGDGDNNTSEFGHIFIIDDNTGTVKETIEFHYDDYIMPVLILPAPDGCYDLFVYRTTPSIPVTKIHIFHTDNLHNLQSDNQ